jgi:hypothetical protein
MKASQHQFEMIIILEIINGNYKCTPGVTSDDKLSKDGKGIL